MAQAATKNPKSATPVKCTEGVRSKASESMKGFENSNPNFATTPKEVRTPQSVKSTGRARRPVARNLNPGRINERRFVVAKKKSNNNSNSKSLAYETLRSSQEEFFKGLEDQGEGMDFGPEQAESPKGALGNASIKRRRDKVMEEARESVPEPGLGRVFHLVRAFEKLLTLPKNSESKDGEEGGEEEDVKKGVKWALPGLQRPKAPETLEESSASFCPDELVLTAESLGFDSSLECSQERSSTGSVRSRRTSSASSRNVGGRTKSKKKKKQIQATSQKPFKLRTEERGKEKEEEFFKKLQEMSIQEEKQRIPIALGLPLTTDEPEIPMKPSVKEITRPLDIKLHSDVRAVERSDFDYQVAEKMNMIEHFRRERERLQKLAEEEEVKRLRKELVPKAQPMPFFDRPFLPKRSVKQPTIPRDPKLGQIQNHNKKMKPCLSWNDFNLFADQHWESG